MISKRTAVLTLKRITQDIHVISIIMIVAIMPGEGLKNNTGMKMSVKDMHA